MAEESKTPQVDPSKLPKIDWDDSNMKSSYANVCNVNGTREEVVLFFGIRTDLGEQALSPLKHFAPHLKTMTLCKYVFPNADYSLPNFKKDEQWKEFLESLVSNLKKGA